MLKKSTIVTIVLTIVMVLAVGVIAFPKVEDLMIIRQKWIEQRKEEKKKEEKKKEEQKVDAEESKEEDSTQTQQPIFELNDPQQATDRNQDSDDQDSDEPAGPNDTTVPFPGEDDTQTPGNDNTQQPGEDVNQPNQNGERPGDIEEGAWTDAF